jgi:hypothetical protein
MTVVHAALIVSNPFLGNMRIMVSNNMAHVSWSEHAPYQWNGQAHVLSIMNVKARVAQRRHARFRPLAYAARSMPHGSIGSPPERGAGVYADRPESHQTRSGHVLALDPAWALIKARVCSVLEPWDPTVGGPDPIRGGPDPILGVRSVHVGVLDQTWRSRLYIQGSGTFPWGPDSLLMPWSISLSLDMWRPRTRPCGGVRRCC